MAEFTSRSRLHRVDSGQKPLVSPRQLNDKRSTKSAIVDNRPDAKSVNRSSALSYSSNEHNYSSENVQFKAHESRVDSHLPSGVTTQLLRIDLASGRESMKMEQILCEKNFPSRHFAKNLERAKIKAVERATKENRKGNFSFVNGDYLRELLFQSKDVIYTGTLGGVIKLQSVDIYQVNVGRNDNNEYVVNDSYSYESTRTMEVGYKLSSSRDTINGVTTYSIFVDHFKPA